MTLKQFIKTYRADIDKVIDEVTYRHDGKGGRGTIPNPPPRHNNVERREWILNEEGLYCWAQNEGVRI